MKEVLFDGLLAAVDQRYGTPDHSRLGIVPWSESILLDGRPFSLAGHEYQRAILEETAARQCFAKGAQLGLTSLAMLKTLHGLLSSRYPSGCLYLFPSQRDVADFSRGRFSPLVRDNPDVLKHIRDTDAQGIKRIGRAFLYLRGARSSGKVGGLKASSSQLKSVPVDRLVFDEMDEVDPAMVDLALERLSHSPVKEEVYLSTPTIPDYGVDKLYQQSDQRIWLIKCEACNHETCLETSFPHCIEVDRQGKGHRLCDHCRQEIDPCNGRWAAQHPEKSKDLVGWWISQLNSLFIDPGKILLMYRETTNLQEFYNSKLGRAYIDAQSRLTEQEVLSLCGDEPIAEEHPGPCFMGVDVGTLLHCVIATQDALDGTRIVHMSAFPDWSNLYSLMRRFHVACAVIDAMPELRLTREFVESHHGEVFACTYSETQRGGPAWDDRKGRVVLNRTEALDMGHAQIGRGSVVLPRECGAVHEFANHCSNVSRILVQDQETGMSKYRYVKTGPDHYRHAHAYCTLALSRAAGGFFAGSIFEES